MNRFESCGLLKKTNNSDIKHLTTCDSIDKLPVGKIYDEVSDTGSIFD